MVKPKDKTDSILEEMDKKWKQEFDKELKAIEKVEKDYELGKYKDYKSYLYDYDLKGEILQIAVKKSVEKDRIRLTKQGLLK